MHLGRWRNKGRWGGVTRNAMRALLRKFVPGLTTAAAAVGFATLSWSVVAGELQWFGAGMLFFPVDEQSLASRLGFALRAGFAAAAACLVHRVLWTAGGLALGSVLDVLRHPSLLLPYEGVDTTLLLALSAVAAATAAAFLAQPTLKQLARTRRPSVASALSAINPTAARSSPARVRSG